MLATSSYEKKRTETLFQRKMPAKIYKVSEVTPH